MKSIQISHHRITILLSVVLFSFFRLAAFDASHYAEQSKLSSGEWVKVRVASSGMHFISAKDLQTMGFSDPSQVKVFGYGATLLPDILEQSTYIDDLPQTPSIATADGIYFYGVGPTMVNVDNAGRRFYRNNPFTVYGYYYLTSSADYDRVTIPSSGSAASSDNAVSVFTDIAQHEVDSHNLGETGHLLVGEDLKYTPSRTFRLDLIDPAEGKINLGASICVNLVSNSSWTLGTSDGDKKTIAAASSSSAGHVHGLASTSWTEVANKGQHSINAVVTLAGGSSNTRAGNVDWVAVNYPRHLRMPADGSSLVFTVKAPAVALANASAATEIWDVTDPTAISRVEHSQPDASGNVYFAPGDEGERVFVAFNPSTSAKLPAPEFVEKVANQNLHSLRNIDMVIISAPQWMGPARNLAQYRSTANGMNVMAINQQEIFNEFSSGSPDVNAFRKMLKMLRDRALATGGTPPRYLLLFGRSSFDNRQLTSATANISYQPIPQWQTYESFNDNTSYPTDDILGMLDDGSGRVMASDTLNLAIGRLPVTSMTQANLMVDKIMEYENSSPSGEWRSRAVFIADDDDSGVHMKQTESMLSVLQDNGAAHNLLPEKIFIDAYEYTNGVATGARDEFYRSLDEGVIWINYVGHANHTTLSSEGILNYSDVGSLFLKKVPFIYAATCDFMRWDAPETSGAEHLAATKGGGVIGAISATRPVYITQNGLLTDAMGKNLMTRDAEGRVLSVGETFRRAKNLVTNDENKLRYCLLADPSMRLLMPEHTIVVETVDGKPFPSTEGDVVLQARQDLKITGSVRDGVTGDLLDDFNGSINTTLYDADMSVTTLGHGSAPARVTFDRHGFRLFAGADSVTGGRFTVNIAMPAEVDNNYRPATIALYASDNEKNTSASRVEKKLYVYGIDEDAVVDTIPPVIESIYLNHPSFVNGGFVNHSPMLIAEISDNHAINMSLAGIGHWMSLSLDEGAVTYNDVSNFYEPRSIDRGNLYYQLDNLEPGYHTLTLRIWDSAGNSTSSTIEFFVDQTVAPQVFDIYSDRNPASETASFYLVHDRPDGDLKVEFVIYDLLGRTVWSNTTTGRADKFKSYPITWNLTDRAGRRVPRGIYVYRATVSDLDPTKGSGLSTLTPAKKIAVTGR